MSLALRTVWTGGCWPLSFPLRWSCLAINETRPTGKCLVVQLSARTQSCISLTLSCLRVATSTASSSSSPPPFLYEYKLSYFKPNYSMQTNDDVTVIAWLEFCVSFLVVQVLFDTISKTYCLKVCTEIYMLREKLNASKVVSSQEKGSCPVIIA